MKEFVHLHNHTEYSLLDGCTRVEKLVQEAKAQGARAVAITDHGNMYGAIKFYKACEKHKVKPIIGCEFYVSDDLTVKTRENNARYHLILLAKNLHGFHNLMKLSSIGYVDGFYDRPRIDYNVLKQYSSDLICLSGCVAGGVSRRLNDMTLDDPYGEALAYAKKTQELFAEGDYYIELQNHFIKEELHALPLLRKIAKEIGAKTVATNDLHYLYKSDAKAHDILLCIQTAKDYDDPNRFRFPNDEFYYKTYDEMLAVIGEEESLDNTLEVADKINLVIPFHQYTIPYYQPQEGYAEDAGWCSKLRERQVPAYNGTTVSVKYDDCNPFYMAAGDFGDVNNLSNHTTLKALDAVVASFGKVSTQFSKFLSNFEIPTDGAEYYPAVEGEAVEDYETFDKIAKELYNHALSEFTKYKPADIQSTAVVGLNYPYAMTFSPEVSSHRADLQTVAAYLFGFNSAEEFANYAKKLVDIYSEYRKNPENCSSAWGNGCFLTDNGSFVFPVAFTNEFSDVVITYMFLDVEGRLSLWMHDVPAALRATNFDAVYHRGNIINSLYCKNVLFVVGGADAEYLRNMAYKGLVDRYGEITPDIKERADYELQTIISMGFASYYLIVWDFINYAKSHDIPVGAGRGSGVGSIIAYAIRITNVDPLKYDLIFERFLNSSRQSMPDFDVDFCSDRREEVIEYVREKYGYDHVTQIITFGKMKKKNAIKNVCRVFKIPFAESNALVKNITDNDKKVHIPNLLDPNDVHAVPELIEMYRNDTYKEIFDIAIQLEDLPKDRGKHAAGVIICPYPVSAKVPLSRNGEDITTQFDMTECEELGLLKMDFLALKTLTDVKMAQDFVEKYEGVKVSFDKLGYEDKEVYQMIGSGETDTVFQLESGGMKGFMKQLKPTLLEEIIAGVSLYRPGPMAYVPAYVYNKQHQSEIDYRHPKLEPILKSTYGIIVYQEQAMRITQHLAGYTLNEADNFRKFISKKKVEEIPKHRAKFVSGCVANGIDEGFALKLWDELEAFGNYAFNKSHAAAYAVLTYQTAFYKHYYPVEYLSAVLNNRLGSPDDTTKYLKLIKDMGIKLLPPDINESEGLFLPENGGIRYGLVCIKNVGKGAIDGVVKERKQGGKFTSFSDFARRVPMDALNRRMIECLIKGGAFDCFGHNRSTLMANYENILAREIKSKELLDGGQMFFDFMLEDDYKYTEVKENRRVKLMDEKEVLGRYLSGHPLDGYEEEFKEFNFDTSKMLPVRTEDAEEDVNDEEGGEEKPDVYQVNNGDRVYFGGLLSGVTIKTSQKTGKKWGYATIEDMVGSTEIVFYARALEQYKPLLVDDALVRIKGKINIGADGVPKIEVQSVSQWALKEKEEFVDKRTLCIRIENDIDLLQKVRDLLERNKGAGSEVIIQVDTYKDGQVKKTGYHMPYTVANPDSLKSSLIGLVGYNNVKFRED